MACEYFYIGNIIPGNKSLTYDENNDYCEKTGSSECRSLKLWLIDNHGLPPMNADYEVVETESGEQGLFICCEIYDCVCVEYTKMITEIMDEDFEDEESVV
jgi:hypothetical protein